MNKRRYIYDYIRVFACICIIGIHCTAGYPYSVTNTTEIINYCVHAVFRIGLPIFTILSGTLILNSDKNEPLLSFYYKRFVKIVIPFFLISLFYSIWSNGNYSLSYLYAWSNWLTLIKEIPKAALATLQTYQSIHLWYVYYILGIYLVAPFFKIMVQNMSEKNQKEFIILVLVMRSIYEFLPLLNIDFGIQYFVFSDGIMYFMLGYILTQTWICKYAFIIQMSGLISYVFSVVIYVCYPDLVTSGIYEASPLMIMQACGMFMFFFQREKNICKNEILNRAVGILSKHAFTIYLVHEFVRSKVNSWNVWKNIFSMELLRALCVILLTFIISFLVAIILDSTLFRVIQDLMLKVITPNKIHRKSFIEQYQWKSIKLKRTCGIFGCIGFIIVIGLICKAELPYDEELIEAESSEPISFIHMESNTRILQRFQISVQKAIKLRSIGTIFININEEDKDGILSLRILDENGKEKYSSEYQISEFVIGDYQELILDKPITIRPKQEYIIEMEVKGTNTVPYLLMQDSLNQNRYNKMLSINDYNEEGTLLINYRYYGIIPDSEKIIIIIVILSVMIWLAFRLGYLPKRKNRNNF